MIEPFAQIAIYPVFGKPLVIYLGMLTFLGFCATAYVGYLVVNGKTKFENHKKMVATAFVVAIIHGILGMSIYF